MKQWLRSRTARWLASALVIGVVLVGLIATLGTGAARGVPVMDSAPPLTVDTGANPKAGLVDARMRNVRYQIDPDIVLTIKGLRGGLLPVGPKGLPVFDDPSSFAIQIQDAEIAIDTASLARLLTRYVFAYQGSPLHDLSVSIKDGELIQKGKLKKGLSFPFMMQGRLSVTPSGEIRVDPHKVEVLGMGVRKMMDLFGLELDDLVKNNRNHGVRIEEDVLYLNPGGMLPPPRLHGHLKAIRVEPGRLVQIFGTADSAVPAPLETATGTMDHYIYFRHSQLRFGKLTMQDVDMLIVNADSTAPVVFSLTRYHEQLVAGHHITTPKDGLVVYMPEPGKGERGKARGERGKTGGERR
jgi:hypothetical protein